MKEIIFPNRQGIYAQRQVLWSYFIADYEVVCKKMEIRPLTIEHLCYALIRNYSRLLYWGFVRSLYKLGFIDIPEAMEFQWKYFRFAFWRPR